MVILQDYAGIQKKKNFQPEFTITRFTFLALLVVYTDSL